jgi:hypothetical protein
VGENRVEPKLNAHNLLAYANDVSTGRQYIYTVNKNTETLNDASTEVGLEINVEKIKFMFWFETRI